jgi:hypothetical protein
MGPPQMAERPRLIKIDEVMRRWCAVLEQDLSTWPDVSHRPMFGMLAFYRGKNIFAALPRTRAADTPYSLLIKLPGVRHDRLSRTDGPGAKWTSFAMESENDIGEALEWLARAYEKAK